VDGFFQPLVISRSIGRKLPKSFDIRDLPPIKGVAENKLYPSLQRVKSVVDPYQERNLPEQFNEFFHDFRICFFNFPE
jgi:hypothetical protein